MLYISEFTLTRTSDTVSKRHSGFKSEDLKEDPGKDVKEHFGSKSFLVTIQSNGS